MWSNAGDADIKERLAGCWVLVPVAGYRWTLHAAD
jgi:hypothetical protein